MISQDACTIVGIYNFVIKEYRSLEKWFKEGGLYLPIECKAEATNAKRG